MEIEEIEALIYEKEQQMAKINKEKRNINKSKMMN